MSLAARAEVLVLTRQLPAAVEDRVMTPTAHRRPPTNGSLRRLPVWCVGAFVAAAFAVVWWATSIGLYHGPDHAIGPFRVPLALEWTVGGVAVGSAGAGCTWMISGRAHASAARISLSRTT